jgi:TRAP-type C4-dicarboxylate transport system substrate-binding protein
MSNKTEEQAREYLNDNKFFDKFPDEAKEVIYYWLEDFANSQHEQLTKEREAIYNDFSKEYDLKVEALKQLQAEKKRVEEVLSEVWDDDSVTGGWRDKEEFIKAFKQ